MLALSMVAGRLLATPILNPGSIALDKQIRLVRRKPGRFAGRKLKKIKSVSSRP